MGIADSSPSYSAASSDALIVSPTEQWIHIVAGSGSFSLPFAEGDGGGRVHCNVIRSWARGLLGGRTFPLWISRSRRFASVGRRARIRCWRVLVVSVGVARVRVRSGREVVNRMVTINGEAEEEAWINGSGGIGS